MTLKTAIEYENHELNQRALMMIEHQIAEAVKTELGIHAIAEMLLTMACCVAKNSAENFEYNIARIDHRFAVFEAHGIMECLRAEAGLDA